MKTEHLLIGLVTFAFLVPSATAVVGGPEADDGEMVIMGDSSSSASQATGPNGTEWRAEVSMVNRTQTVEDERLENVRYGEENYTVEFDGFITAPTPCHTVGHDVSESNDGYVLDITTERDNETGACTQVMTTIEYDGSFSTDEDFTLEVRHGNQTVDTLEHPGMEKERKGLFSGFMNWLSGLF